MIISDQATCVCSVMHLESTSEVSLSSSGPEGALFQHSVEVPLLKSELLKDLR